MSSSFQAIVRGRVQGVYFRASTQRVARELGLVGSVRNLPDGSVAVEACGPRDALERLVAFLERGPEAARVDDVDLDWRDIPVTASDFHILD